jgi:menaquinone-9 beta-reductase
MHIKDPLIVGAGPAGCAAAITLARAGHKPLLIDRNAEPGDALCGGFLSWETAKRLTTLGIDVAALGAHPVTHMALYAGDRSATVRLPAPSWGLSRHALDTALKREALAVGAHFEQRSVKRYRQESDSDWFGTIFDTDTGPIAASDVFLATGKHDVRPVSRIHDTTNPTLGLRIVVRGNSELAELVDDRIELHLVDGGYCGIVAQEDGRVNICMAVRKWRLSAAGKDPRTLLEQLAAENAALALRLGHVPADAPVDSIGSVPYGWRKTLFSSFFRLGDQAAVIPSLAGEGIDIALASGIAAANELIVPKHRGYAFQERFALKTAIPVKIASALWHAAEKPAIARRAVPFIARMPSVARLAARLTRIG